MESKICRACLDRTATISLFEQHDNIQYREKLSKCVSVTIEEGDGFPDSICENCATELTISYEFAQKCEASDRALRCLGLLQTPAPAPVSDPTEHLQPELKIEPESANEPLVYYDDYDDQIISEPKDDWKDLEIADIIKSEENTVKDKTRPKKKNYNTPVPSNLRNIKHREYSGPIQCMTCGRILRCQSVYEMHLRTHTKERPFICDICKKGFTTKDSVKRHIEKHYGMNYEPLLEWDGRKKLRNIKLKSLPVLCVICGQGVKSNSALVNHMRKHTGDKPFSCPECDKCYPLKGSLMKHIKVNHIKEKPTTRFVCEHCGKKFYSKSTIIAHLRVHTGEKPYACPFCKHKFGQLSSLIRHKRRHTGERPFSCQTCSKAFRDSSLLKKHQSVHSKDRNFLCHICNKGLKSKAALNAHIERHKNPGKYICNVCGTTFTVQCNLKMHMKRIHSEKAGTCNECHKTVSNLQAHLRTHSGERVFVCKLCKQRFMTQRSLTYHMGFKHRDAAKFKCSTGECTKAFPLISMLEYHVLKAHLDTTPYVCQHCARGFLRPSDLSRHLKVNHMDITKVKSQFIKTVKTCPPT